MVIIGDAKFNKSWNAEKIASDQENANTGSVLKETIPTTKYDAPSC